MTQDQQRQRTRKSERRPSDTETRSVEGASLATLDAFMRLIGEEADAPLVKPTKRNNFSGPGEPLSVKALDFVGLVFGKKEK